MGVPAFFASLIKNSLVSILRKSEQVGIVDCLYFDLNCLIHPQCFKIVDKNIDLSDMNVLEEKMMEQIIKYTNHIIRFVSPKSYVYFAVDGTAPLAKIAQQRKRRFEYANDYRTEIKKKYGIPYNKWSNVVVTPGTKFMEKLHHKIVNYYSDKNNLDNYAEGNRKLKILYSSYHVPGEGEHKILQDLKVRYKENESLNICIYGLDADLIFLAMASNIKNIFLVREDSNFNRSANSNDLHIFEELTYVDMDSTIFEIDKMIEKEVNSILGKYKNDYYDDNDNSYKCPDIGKISFIDDYILFCFLLGNDFLPHFYSLDIKRGGMEISVKSYARAIIRNNGKRMIERTRDNDVIINNSVFIDYINIIAQGEADFFRYKLRKYIKTEQIRKRCNETEQWKIEIWKVENLIDVNEPDNMKLGINSENEWNYSYYQALGSEGSFQKDLKKDMCQNYIEGIMWVFNYYFKECIDYTWQYKFSHGPLMTDLREFLGDFDINNIIFEKKESIPIFVQLLAVLPSSFNEYLPRSYRFLTTTIESPIIDMFPVKYKTDTTYQTQRFKCPQMIPHAELSRLMKASKNLKLTTHEKIRGHKEIVPLILT